MIDLIVTWVFWGSVGFMFGCIDKIGVSEAPRMWEFRLAGAGTLVSLAIWLWGFFA